MIVNVREKYPLFLSEFNESWISSEDFRKKNSNIKFHKNTSNGRRVVPFGRTEKHEEAISCFSQFANPPEEVLRRIFGPQSEKAIERIKLHASWRRVSIKGNYQEWGCG